MTLSRCAQESIVDGGIAPQAALLGPRTRIAPRARNAPLARCWTRERGTHRWRAAGPASADTIGPSIAPCSAHSQGSKITILKQLGRANRHRLQVLRRRGVARRLGRGGNVNHCACCALCSARSLARDWLFAVPDCRSARLASQSLQTAATVPKPTRSPALPGDEKRRSATVLHMSLCMLCSRSVGLRCWCKALVLVAAWYIPEKPGRHLTMPRNNKLHTEWRQGRMLSLAHSLSYAASEKHIVRYCCMYRAGAPIEIKCEAVPTLIQ
jgi:hypothetical protein